MQKFSEDMREEEEEEEKIQLYQNLKQEIRSLLISSPKSKYGGITGGLLYFDYKQLNSGKEIPCKYSYSLTTIV